MHVNTEDLSRIQGGWEYGEDVFDGEDGEGVREIFQASARIHIHILILILGFLEWIVRVNVERKSKWK